MPKTLTDWRYSFSYFNNTPYHQFRHLTVCVTGRWAGVDNAWEEYKPEARKMLDAKRGDESHLSSARFVRRGLERVAFEAWQ